MKTRLFPALLLVAVILAACAPAPATQPSEPPPILEIPSATPATPGEVVATQPAVVVDAPTQAPPLAVATSRGPNLEATDPSTVSLASGGYQLVEFFRFT